MSQLVAWQAVAVVVGERLVQISVNELHSNLRYSKSYNNYGGYYETFIYRRTLFYPILVF